jgi:hypothetical protein
MTATWQNDGSGWQLVAPTGSPDEQTLHGLVEEATQQILPLATPRSGFAAATPRNGSLSGLCGKG